MILGVAAWAPAALPEGARVVQAESMALSGEGWSVREHSPDNWYAGRPVGQMLGGQNNKPGSAAAEFPVDAAGTYRLWIRYLDMVNYRSHSAFRVAVSQRGEEAAHKAFDAAENSPRATPEGERKWGAGFSRWVWDFVEFRAEAGPLRVAVEKQHLQKVHSFTRTLDMLILTDDPAYEPRETDVSPLYLRIRMSPEQKKPVAIHFWGRRPFAPWYTPHANINRKGIFQGAGTGAEDRPDLRLAASDESPWVDVSPYLGYGGLNQISLYAMRSFHQPEAEASFEVAFSKTPSETGLIKTASRSGAGAGLVFAVDLSDGRLVTESEGSAASLAMARATPTVPGTPPAAFPFFTGMKLDGQRSTAEAVDNEREALRLIGIAGEHKRPSHFYFHLTRAPGCLGQPDRERIEAHAREVAQKNPDRSGWTAVNLMDEPGFGFEHAGSCAACREGFKPFLNKLGVSEAEAAALSLNNRPDGTNAVEKASYYYTRRYMNHLMTEMLRAGTDSFRRHLPGVPTTANFACELLDGNLVSRCVDWYEILGTGALTFGWNEDWGGWARTRQVNGFYVDVMRSACRRPGYGFGIYNILCRTGWEIQARAFLEFGHGVKAMSFFNYGPYYAITSDANSHRPEIYEAIKRVTFAVGPVEKAVLAGRPARGDAAQLLSVSGDIWQATRDNVYGKERAWLNLLLRHCNVRCDVLCEDELGACLADYTMLFATDANLKRAALAPLLEWVRSGGTLYLGAGALARDEFDAPLGLDGALGLSRGPLDFRADPGRAEYEMLKLKPLAEHRGMKLFCGTQQPLERTVPAGRGKIILSGFFPAVGYIATSKRPEGADFSTLDFEAAHRAWLASVLAEGGVRPRLRSDTYRVEANLIESPSSDVLALSNWTGAEQTVVLELDRAPDYRAITPVTGRLLAQERTGETLRLKLAVAAGDLIELKR
jgi:hypothetical protein